MICKHCGAEIPDIASFCVMCGKPVKSGADVSRRSEANIVTIQDDDLGDPDMTMSVSDDEPEDNYGGTASSQDDYAQYDEPQIIRRSAGSDRRSDDAVGSVRQDAEFPDAVPASPRRVVPQPVAPQPGASVHASGSRAVQPQAVSPQRASQNADVNALRNNVVAGFAYRHYNRKDYFGTVEGEQKQFSLFGGILDVTPDKDLFNTYRLRFRDIASKYADKFIREYSLLVVNLETFVQFYPAIYLSNMEYMINAAMDVLSAENVWIQTFASFYQRHAAKHREAMDAYYQTVRSVNMAAGSSAMIAQGIMGRFPGAGAGFSAGANAIAGSEAMTSGMNYRSDVIVQNVIKAAMLSPVQKTAIFGGIVPSVLFNKVFADYWQVFLSVAELLRENGKDVWLGTEEMSAQADNMFRNLTNPQFPKDKTNELLLQLLRLYPYKKPVFFWMSNAYGNTPELSAVREYFGYADLRNPRIY